MGLKGYGLWFNLIQRAEPHRERLGHALELPAGCVADPAQLEVAVRVAFRKARFETGFSLDRCKV
jgi:hypothetical protein